MPALSSKLDNTESYSCNKNQPTGDKHMLYSNTSNCTSLSFETLLELTQMNFQEWYRNESRECTGVENTPTLCCQKHYRWNKLYFISEMLKCQIQLTPKVQAGNNYQSMWQVTEKLQYPAVKPLFWFVGGNRTLCVGRLGCLLSPLSRCATDVPICSSGSLWDQFFRRDRLSGSADSDSSCSELCYHVCLNIPGNRLWLLAVLGCFDKIFDIHLREALYCSF